ncbi:hypothetical protein ACQY0O_004040 [Thecaphora frezii]
MAYKALHERFNLPPPPPRSRWAFNRPHEWQRAWIPDMSASPEPVQEMHRFLIKIFLPDFDEGTYIQLKLLATVVGTEFLIIGLILLRRMYQKSFWLFRLHRRSNGILIVPNAITVFCIVQGCFGVLLIAVVWLFIDFGHGYKRAEHAILWVTLVWIPMALGTYLAAIGAMYARPDALRSISPRFDAKPSLAARMGITPAVVNVVVFCSPLVFIVAVLVPSVMADQRWQRALGEFDAWSQQWAGATELNREMLLQVQSIWYEMLDGARLISLCTATWAVTGCAVVSAYIYASGSLALVVRRQIKTLANLQANQSFSESFAAQQQRYARLHAQQNINGSSPVSRPTTAVASLSTSSRTVKRGIEQEGAPATTPPSTKPWSLKQRWKTSSGPEESGSDEDTGDDDFATAQIESAYFTQAQLEAPDQPADNYFPSIKPSTIARPPQATVSNGRCKQRRYLQHCYVDIVVQCTATVIGALFYLVTSVAMTFLWYPRWEANNINHTLSVAFLVVTYGAVVCGGALFLSILGRTYEPVFVNMLSKNQAVMAMRRRHAQSLSERRRSAHDPDKAVRRQSSAMTWVASAYSTFSSMGKERHDRKATASSRNLNQYPLLQARSVYEESNGAKASTPELGPHRTISGSTSRSRRYDFEMKDHESAAAAEINDQQGSSAADHVVLPSRISRAASHGVMIQRTVTRQYEPATPPLDAIAGMVDIDSPHTASSTPSALSYDLNPSTPWTSATPCTPPLAEAHGKPTGSNSHAPPPPPPQPDRAPVISLGIGGWLTSWSPPRAWASPPTHPQLEREHEELRSRLSQARNKEQPSD